MVVIFPLRQTLEKSKCNYDYISVIIKYPSIFYGDFYWLNLSITNSIGKHQQKYIVGIYQENPSWSRKNKKNKE